MGGSATLSCRHVVLRNLRRTIGLVCLGVLVLVLGVPVMGLGFGWAGAVIGAVIASLASFVQAGSGSVNEDSVFPIASIGPATRPAVIARRSSTWRAERSRMSLAPPTFRDQALGIDDYERCVAAVRPVSCAPPEDPPLGEQP